MFQQANSDILKHDQLVEDGVLRDYFLVEAKEVVAYLPVMKAAIDQTAKSFQEFYRGVDASKLDVAGLKKFNEVTAQTNELSLLKQKYLKLEAQANTAASVQRKAEINEKKAQVDLDKKINAEKDKGEKATRKEQSAYAQLNAELVKNRQISKDLQAMQVQGIKLTEEQASALTQATGETQRLDGEIKKIDYSLGNAQRNVGNYNNQLGTLGRSIKGFGMLGLILSRAIGVDPEVFYGIKEVGLAIRDVKHITEGAEMAKEGETAAHAANITVIEAETFAYEEEAVAAGISTGGIILLVGALIGAGYAVYEYISALHEQKEEEEKLKKVEEERLKLFIKTKELEAKTARERHDLKADEMVLEGKLSEAGRERAKLNADFKEQEIQSKNDEEKAIGDLTDAYKIDLKEYEKYLKDKDNTDEQFVEGGDIQARKYADYEAAVTQAKEDGRQARIQLQQAYNVKSDKITLDHAEKETKDENAALKQLEDIIRKADEATLKAKAKTNEEKVQVDYDAAQKEIDAVKASEREKQKARLSIEREYRLKFAEARQKDEDDAEKIIKDNIAALQKWADQKFKISEKEADDEKKNISDVGKWSQQESKKNIDREEKEDAERRARIQKIEDDITSGVEEGLKTRSELQQQADQHDIDFHKRTIDVQAKLAAAGKENTLAQEQASATKAEEKKLQDAKRAAKIQEDLTLLKVFADSLTRAMDKGEPFIEAVPKALAETGATKEIFAKLFSGTSGYYEGTDSLGEDGAIKLPGGKDNLLIRAQKTERIFGVEDSAKVAGATNAEIIANHLMFKEIYQPAFNAANVTSTATSETRHDLQLAHVIEKRFDALQKAIEAKPETRFVLGEKMGDYKEEIKERGMTTIIHHFTQAKRPRL